jgi:DNA-binding helix-hairpin-helix protein with protein kinase domain
LDHVPTQIDYRSISGQLQELGRGGEGVVYSAANLGSRVYKEFFATSRSMSDQVALEGLIELQNQWTEEERVWLTQRTVWPETLVLDQGQLKGFIMPSIEQRYFRKHVIGQNQKTILCEWNYLSFREKLLSNPKVVSEIPRVSTVDAIALVHDLSKTIKLLHKHGVIIGDVSGKNLLWTDSPNLQSMIIDCDSFKIVGSGDVAWPKQSPDWEDPYLNGKPTSQESDIYKLALAAYRSIWAAGTDHPQLPDFSLVPKPNGVTDERASLIERSLAETSRPTAEEWEHVLAVMTA